jgi:hypothetical protein
MFHEHAEALSGQYPLEYQGGIPNPARFPPAPDELLAFVRQYHRGLSRVTVKLWQGRKRYGQLNAITVGARHDELPTASVDQIVRAIMAVAQDYYEGVDTPCKFMCQAHVYTKATGDPTRKALHFELGAGPGEEHGYSYAESIGAPEQVDDVLLSHIRECHREILDQAKIISEIGREAITNAGQVFQAKQEALDAQAQAQMVVMDARREERSQAAQEKKWERGFKMLEKAINTGIAQAVVSNATGVSLPMPGATPGAEPQQIAAPTTPPPSWAAAATGAKVLPAAAPELDTDEDEDDEDMTYASKGAKLYASITADQWPDLFEALTKTQMKLLRVLQNATDDAAVLEAAGKFRKGLKEASMKRLAQILTIQQVAAVIELASAAEDDG